MQRRGESEFDTFRQERQRSRAKAGPQPSVLGYENAALRELEQVEQREIRDQQLSREVHDFFAAATKKAASIVERVAQDAEKQIGERVEVEVEGFLMDALSRMNTFILTVLQQRRFQGVAETHVEPSVGNIVGPGLDEFRWAGTPEGREAHIGQDPFDTPVEDVQAEFRAVVAGLEGAEADAAVPIEEHLVAEMTSEETAPDATAANDAELDESSEPPQDATEDATPVDPQAELEQFKSALKALVRQGVLGREEARAAWMARLAKLGRAPR
ncbi:MAG: hypothetical protein H6835_13260 [Planctomycetes bacterium]|nr:hypothetical protein [Planctomycetota bacterium]